MYKLHINDKQFLENIEKYIKNNNIKEDNEYEQYLYSNNGIFILKKHRNVHKIIKLKLLQLDLSHNIKNYISEYENKLLLDSCYFTETNEIYNLPEEYYETKIIKTIYRLDENIYFIKLNEKWENNCEKNLNELNYYYLNVNNIDNNIILQKINKIINN